MDNFNPFSLKGKVILVSGASSGIGRSIAVSCSLMGAKLYITARNKERLEETLSQLYGDSHQMVLADLTKSDDREHLASIIPTLDGIVHNAGVGARILCKDITESDLDDVMIPNFNAHVLLQSTILSKKKVNREASIVFITSRAADRPSMGNAIYSASKGALISYAKCLGLELAPRKIRVNCILPAMVQTHFIEKSGMDQDMMEDIKNRYPLKRYGQPEDIANLCIYLLSDASSWMTGSCIDITGGGEGTLI